MQADVGQCSQEPVVIVRRQVNPFSTEKREKGEHTTEQPDDPDDDQCGPPEPSVEDVEAQDDRHADHEETKGDRQPTSCVPLEVVHGRPFCP